MSQQKYNARTEKNIATLQPDFASRVRQWLAACRQQGLNPLIHYGSRTPAEQQALHDKYLNHEGPKAVAPERSYHCYGRAFDWVNITNPDAGESGLNWDDDDAYAKGTQIGGSFKIAGIGSSDNDHLQDANYPSFTNLPKADFGHFPTGSSATSAAAAAPVNDDQEATLETPSAGTGPLKNKLFADNAEIQRAAMSLRPPFSRSADRSESVGILQDALDRVLPPSDLINAGPSRGIFGPRTEQAVIKFQQGEKLGVDGQVGRNTLRALDRALDSTGIIAPQSTPPASGSLAAILQIAVNSDIARYYWNDRGYAPIGYTKGMALVFGRVYCKLKIGDAAAMEMAQADRNAMATDALSHYRPNFHAIGMENSVNGADTLRHLFVLLLGLGMRESSGAHCEGRDTSNPNSFTSDTAEAGLFQTSWNAHSASPLMEQLFQAYLPKPTTGFMDVFHEHVTCSPADWQNHGSGTGAAFQELSKKCPAFAAEFAGIGLRNIRTHWGPINTHKAEIRPEADAMFKQVQEAIDASNLCPIFG